MISETTPIVQGGHAPERRPEEVTQALDLSIIIPIHNEEDSIPQLLERLFAVLSDIPGTVEVIAIDDGSTDSSFELLRSEAERRPRLKVICLRRNYGQTAAMMAGIDHATGRVIVSMDGDLQNDPADIPSLLAKLDEGYDVVSGWRISRKDPRFRRALTSRIANWLISGLSGLKLHDYGCALKAYRGEIIKGVKLYGEMHRFIPIYARWQGARVTEIPVRHHPRVHGVSTYGLERVFKVVLDLMVVKFLERYFVKPIYVFGGVGLSCIALSLLAVLVAIGGRLFADTAPPQAPLLILSVLLFLAGALSILMGLLAEMVARTYFESQRRPSYAIRESLNL